MAARRLFKDYVSAAVFILLEVASLYILAKDSQARSMWLGKGFQSVMGSVWGKADRIRTYFNLDEENERLNNENSLLLSKFYGLNQGNGSSDALSWPALRNGFTFLPANIVTMTNGSQHNYLIVDRGADDGVEEEDGVITPCGVIGIIQSVGRRYSYALSYANQDMVISAKLGRDGVVGSIRWNGRNSSESILGDIPIHTEITMGDTVFTSGFSSIFPPDIPLGTVVDKKINNGSTADLTVSLLEDFRKVSRVIIVKCLGKKEIEELTEQNEEG